MSTTFENWFAEEQAKGLVDIKFAITGGKGVSLRAVQNELMMSETMVSAGLVQPAPQATSMMPERISSFVDNLK
jgi:hypothetical protein